MENKDVKAMINIISKITKQIQYPNLPVDASNIRINQSLKIIGFSEEQIENIRNYK